MKMPLIPRFTMMAGARRSARRNAGSAGVAAERAAIGRSVAMRTLPLLCLAILAVPSGFAGTADYPAKPVRLLVPYPAGGSFDIFARVIAQKLSTAFERQFVVDKIGRAHV